MQAYGTIFKLLDAPESKRDKEWALKRLDLYSQLESELSRERINEVRAEEALAKLVIEQERIRARMSQVRSVAHTQKNRVVRLVDARDALKRHIKLIGLHFK